MVCIDFFEPSRSGALCPIEIFAERTGLVGSECYPLKYSDNRIWTLSVLVLHSKWLYDTFLLNNGVFKTQVLNNYALQMSGIRLLLLFVTVTNARSFFLDRFSGFTNFASSTNFICIRISKRKQYERKRVTCSSVLSSWDNLLSLIWYHCCVTVPSDY